MMDRYTVKLAPSDERFLDGRHGEAARFAMSVVVQMAEASGAEELISVEQAHIDACALMSRSSLDLVRYLLEHGGQVAVPTTLSMVSLDLEHWETLGVPASFAEMATQIANAYLGLGCIPVWSCAPYQGYLTPQFGQQLAWGESNAVVYANSVLGARTNRYADYLDICAAITGRVPFTGLHRLEGRAASLRVEIAATSPHSWSTTASWAALGSVLGRVAEDEIPAIQGLPRTRPTRDMLKALGAAAASTGSVGLYHIVGVTPEAPTLESACQRRRPSRSVVLDNAVLRAAWYELSSKDVRDPVDAVILGCPHFSYAEFAQLAHCIATSRHARIHENVQFLVFSSATDMELARRGGLLEPIRAFGATLIHDTCPFHSPVVSPHARVIMTNSGKCAYYAPGELDVSVCFGSLDRCVDAAGTAQLPEEEAPW